MIAASKNLDNGSDAFVIVCLICLRISGVNPDELFLSQIIMILLPCASCTSEKKAFIPADQSIILPVCLRIAFSILDINRICRLNARKPMYRLNAAYDLGHAFAISYTSSRPILFVSR